jgi:hypothetical protein
MVAPILVFFQGYDAGREGYNLDDDPEALNRLVGTLYRMGTYWRTFNQALGVR